MSWLDEGTYSVVLKDRFFKMVKGDIVDSELFRLVVTSACQSMIRTVKKQ